MTKKLIVSDHAALRFIQRKHGIDTDGLKHHIAQLVPAGLVQKAGGNLKYSSGNVVYVIENYVLKTVMQR